MKEESKNNLKDNKPSLSLSDFLDINEWQKIQDNFSIVTGVCLRTVDSKGNPITLPSRKPHLCNNLLKAYQLQDKLCGRCLPTFLGGSGVVDRNLSFVCHAGLSNFVAPLRLDSRVFGYIIVGPLALIMRKPKEQYQKMAEELNIDAEELWEAILEIKVTSFQGALSLVELVRGVGEYTIKLAYQNVISGKERGMAPDSSKLSKLLDALLEVAFQVSGADVGSIMFLDKDEELTIQASRGIPDEIVKSTRVRLGDGISGMAARERTPFLIDDDIKDNRIRPYLKRRYISSSMVIPINVKERVMGVMNLGTLRASAIKFTNESLRVMNKLVELTRLAIESLK